MDMPVAAGLRRTFDADGDKRERLDQNFFHRVYAGYEQLFSFAPLTDIMHCIDAQGTKKEVEERIGEVVFS